MRYDRDGDQHYDVISAFIKSIRGSDADAAVHYLARMLEAGEDPRFIARRLVVHASEDVGLADPTALLAASAAAQAVQLIGLPEARINLAQATIHLALAPKSNAVVRAIDAAQADVRAGKAGSVPPALRDAHYSGAKKLGAGARYVYPPDTPDGVVRQQYPPDELVGHDYYAPSGRGAERAVGRAAGAAARDRRGVRATGSEPDRVVPVSTSETGECLNVRRPDRRADRGGRVRPAGAAAGGAAAQARPGAGRGDPRGPQGARGRGAAAQRSAGHRSRSSTPSSSTSRASPRTSTR